MSQVLKPESPISLAFIFASLLFIAITASRLLIRNWYFAQAKSKKTKVAIYGAGASGIQLLSALDRSDKYHPVALVDDNPALWNTVLFGLKVHSPEQMESLTSALGIEQVLLALPSIARSRRREILNSLANLPLRVRTIPGMADLVSGKSQIQEIRDVDVEDLLGRDAVEPREELLARCVTGKQVLVTGAGGSIGSELCRQLVKEEPTQLVLLDSCEFALYDIERELLDIIRRQELKVKVVPFLATILDEPRIREIITAFRIHTIYHAAAYKHVPMVEQNVIAGVRNNILGTYICARAAMDLKVEKFVLISTDKAVRPTNVMGATKRLSELVLQGLAQVSESTVFCMVRFGNVLGSSGSVVPLFKQQINNGGPLTVTHPEIIRYFMTIPEAAQLVIRLMGLQVKTKEYPEGDIEIKFTGLRPGEKLYEELLIGDNPSGTDHPRIMCAEEITLPWDVVQKTVKDLQHCCEQEDCKKIREILMDSETGYTPNTELADFLWCAKAGSQKIGEKVVTVFPGSKERA